VENWQEVLDLVVEKGWKCQYCEGERVLPVPRAETVLAGPADADCPELRVWPAADVLAIFRLHADDELDFDVDLRELQDSSSAIVSPRRRSPAAYAGLRGPRPR
jgi:hypothetical protein